MRRGDCSESVVNVKAADERRLYQVTLAQCAELELRALKVHSNITRPKLRIGPLAVGEKLGRLSDTVDKPATKAIIEIDHCAAHLFFLLGKPFKQECFRIKIRVHRLVKI